MNCNVYYIYKLQNTAEDFNREISTVKIKIIMACQGKYPLAVKCVFTRKWPNKLTAVYTLVVTLHRKMKKIGRF
jgi:hypothetical protein